MILSIFPDVLSSPGAGDEGKKSGIAPRSGIVGIASGQGDNDMEVLMETK